MGRSASTLQFRYIVTGIAAILLAMYAIFIRQYDSITSLQAAYATLIVMLGALPGVVFLLNKREAGLIPLMPLHGIFYALTFGLPVFSNKTAWLAGGEDEINAALVLTIFGLLCLYLGYYAFRRLYGGLKPIRSRNVPLHQQIKAAWILFGIFLAFQFFPILNSLPSVQRLSAPLGYLSLGILALLAFGDQLSRWHLVLFKVSVAFTLLVTTLSGSLAPTVLFLAFFGILYWNKKRRIPWHFILLSAFIAILLNPIKPQFRDVTWYAQESVTSLSYYDKAILLSGVVQEYYSRPEVFAIISEDTSTVNRLAHISTFGYVMKMTPTAVPYWSGDSYRTLWTSFIPRALWPGKPQATIGQDFGHRYTLIGQDDEWTSINLPWLVEFYANFGTLGVLTGMFFVGVFFRILVQKFRVPVSAPLEHVLAVTIIFGLFYAESNFALMVGGILSTFIAFIVLLRLLTHGRAAASSTHVRRIP